MREQTPEFAETVERQQQIVTRAQLLAAGYDDMYLYRQARRGLWQRVLPATYALVTGTLTDEQRRISAALYAGAAAQVTGLAALLWYGFRQSPRTADVHLIVPHHARRASAGHAVVARALALDPRARRTPLYAVCSPARAVVDAARGLRQLRPVRAVVAEAVQGNFTDLATLDEEIGRARRSRTALVRRAFAEVVDGTRSAPEAELRDCLAGSSLLPEILWNPLLRTARGERLPTPDGYLPDAAVALEMDSREYHLSPADWARTLDRHNELSRHGALILHFTPAQLRRDPARVCRTVEDAYASRRGAGAAIGIRVASGEAPPTA
ncbi:type IV toxin-antitoxin system AbiEi family antitoxin domain-containing protein [Micromonospora endolithica]|uniref:AbiEi antitoxin N-terminal domain-containing protein n=1 Tax=Micromonospora endolithica TaxID=230091 RepID=A0A3A9Z391_9ACTN|nr:type IV toxin-antitoxin system AbiEi family antitoxin domain-containing protein [Micromonospora endolithica]RKN42695.1 hypothetical protein D7223_21905 [Micromonospora endolithica]TWJ20080.1 hypothetical protein JD76_00173 [Micromonospora endolithica]